MKRTLIFYFHGYNGSPASSKVRRLVDDVPHAEVYSFDINVDPRVSFDALCNKITSLLAEDTTGDQPLQLFFVGTSLGAWYAARVGLFFSANADKIILINPSLDPANSLKKYGVEKDILECYSKIAVNEVQNNSLFDIFLAKDDDVIDNSALHGGWNVSISRSGTHRFDGEEFDAVSDRINALL